MDYCLYSIYDRIAQTYGRPFVARNDYEAQRTVAHEVNTINETNLLHNNAADYELHRIGNWNDEDGTATPDKQLVTNLLNLRKPAQ